MNESSIRVNFINGRCFFNDFNENDKDPQTGKAGVKYHYSWVGFILEQFFGAACRLPCIYKGKQSVVYINRENFDAWKYRHERDDYLRARGGISDSYFNIDDFNKNIETAIEKICSNLSYRRQFAILPKTLSYEDVINKAGREFRNYPSVSDLPGDSIIRCIEYTLKLIKYKERVEARLQPMLPKPSFPLQIGSKEQLIVFKFLRELPGMTQEEPIGPQPM